MAQLNRSQGKLLEKVITEEFETLYYETQERYYREVDAQRAAIAEKVKKINERFQKRFDSLLDAVQEAVDKEGLRYGWGEEWRPATVLPRNNVWRGAVETYDRWHTIGKRINDEKRRLIREVQLAQLQDTEVEDFLSAIPSVEDFLS